MRPSDVSLPVTTPSGITPPSREQSTAEKRALMDVRNSLPMPKHITEPAAAEETLDYFNNPHPGD